MNLIHGDCATEMKTFPSDYIHLTMTSPPYDNLRTYNGNNEQWNENVWMSVIEELFRITKQGGVVVWVVGDATIKGSETGTSFKQALWAMDCGFKLHDTMIWHKGSFTGVGSLSVRYAPTWEFMFVFVKGAIGTFNPIKDRRNKVKGKIRGNLRKPDGTMKRMSTNGNDRTEYGQRFSVWEIPPCGGNKTGHPAPFPENLCRDHIISWSNEGDTVLDPFMGSGTTGRAAKVLNREFIGIEIDLEYYQIAGKRIAELEKA